MQGVALFDGGTVDELVAVATIPTHAAAKSSSSSR